MDVPSSSTSTTSPTDEFEPPYLHNGKSYDYSETTTTYSWPREDGEGKTDDAHDDGVWSNTQGSCEIYTESYHDYGGAYDHGHADNYEEHADDANYCDDDDGDYNDY